MAEGQGAVSHHKIWVPEFTITQDHPRQVTEKERPCEIHLLHRPATVINELHHIFPQELQREVWGETLDQRVVSICATGHNTVTQAWLLFLKDNSHDWPKWLVGVSRDICELGWQRYQDALRGK